MGSNGKGWMPLSSMDSFELGIWTVARDAAFMTVGGR